MSADLIERLTKPVRMRHRFGSMVEKSSPAIQHEAADALAAKDTALSEMRAELERARKALEPFGHFSENFQPEDGWSPTDLLTISIDDARLAEISMSCFYAADRALASQDEGEER